MSVGVDVGVGNVAADVAGFVVVAYVTADESETVKFLKKIMDPPRMFDGPRKIGCLPEVHHLPEILKLYSFRLKSDWTSPESPRGSRLKYVSCCYAQSYR